MNIMKEIVEHYYSGKFDDFIAYLDDGITWTSHKMSNVQLKNKEEVCHFLYNSPFERFTFENTNFIQDENRLVVEGICTYFNTEAKKVENFYCDIFTFYENKIVKVSSYFI